MKKLLIIPAIAIVVIAVLWLVGINTKESPKNEETTADKYTEVQDTTDSSADSDENFYEYVVTEVMDTGIVVAEIGDEGVAVNSREFLVPNLFYPSTEIKVGNIIKIHHSGEIVKAYPMIFTEVYAMEYYDEETGESVYVSAS